jgi:polyamine oxidase
MDWLPTTALQTAYEYWNIDYTFAQPPEDSSFANTFGQEAGIENEVDDFVVDQR